MFSYEVLISPVSMYFFPSFRRTSTYTRESLALDQLRYIWTLSTRSLSASVCDREEIRFQVLLDVRDPLALKATRPNKPSPFESPCSRRHGIPLWGGTQQDSSLIRFERDMMITKSSRRILT